MNELLERNERQREIDRQKDIGRRGLVLAIAVECDICRRQLDKGAGYHQVTLGMNESPYFVLGPPKNESAVESTTEMTVCTRCEPAVTVAFDAFLATLWALRAKDAGDDELDDEPTLRTPTPPESAL